jgi:membrane fusion protein, multidrug efflux system
MADTPKPPVRSEDPHSTETHQPLPTGKNAANQGDKPAGDRQAQDDGAQDDARSGEPEKPTKSLLQRPVLLAVIALVVLCVLIGALLWWLHSRKFESTDDAFVDVRIVRLAPQVAGRVSQVLVNDNQAVAAGQPLVLIDSATLQTATTQAEAQKAQAQAEVDNATAQISVSEAAYQQAQSDVVAARAVAENSARDLARYEELQRINPAAVAQQQFEQAQTAAAQNAAQLEAARQAATTRAAQVTAARTQVAAGTQQLNAAQAQLATAGINLGYARIVAPVSGHVAQLTVAVGNYVEPGTQMLAIVPVEVWVTANFKETQLALMRIGQRVAIKVDACAKEKIEGHVDSIQRGAGQAFGILPPENATGNFVKVVQRVPVKIVFDNPPADCPLGPGMSVQPSVRVR